jgi:hypothetical protein
MYVCMYVSIYLFIYRIIFCVYTEANQLAHFDPDYRGTMYLRNVGNIAHIHML